MLQTCEQFFLLNKFDTDSIQFYKEDKNHDNELIQTSALFFTFVSSSVFEGLFGIFYFSNMDVVSLALTSFQTEGPSFFCDALRTTEKHLTVVRMICALYSRSSEVM